MRFPPGLFDEYKACLEVIMIDTAIQGSMLVGMITQNSAA